MFIFIFCMFYFLYLPLIMHLFKPLIIYNNYNNNLYYCYFGQQSYKLFHKKLRKGFFWPPPLTHALVSNSNFACFSRFFFFGICQYIKTFLTYIITFLLFVLFFNIFCYI